jgi:hypothetical protein
MFIFKCAVFMKQSKAQNYWAYGVYPSSGVQKQETEHRTMDKVHKRNSSVQHIPSSESFQGY